MPRTSRPIVAAACVLALVAGAWVATRPTNTPSVSPTDEKLDAAPRAKSPRSRTETVAPRDADAPSSVEDATDDETAKPFAVRVTSKATAALVVGATVVITDADANPHEATTDAAGFARFVAKNVFVRIVVTAPGFLSRKETATRSDTDGERTLDVALERAVAASGIVTELGGRAVAGARVWVPNQPEGPYTGPPLDPLATATSGADGAFEIGMPADRGEQKVIVSAPRHVVTTIRWSPASKERMEIRLPPAGVVRGVVHDPSGAPAEGARVTATRFENDDGSEVRLGWEEFGTTDAEGRYEIDHLPLGATWRVRASKGGFAHSTAATVALDAGAAEATRDLVLRRMSRIDVHVLDPHGRPVAAGQVSCDSEVGGWFADLGPEGHETFDVACPGACRVSVDAPGFLAQEIETTVAEGETRAVTMTLAVGAAISGVAVDDLGAPVVGAQVRTGTGRSAETDAVGAFRIAGLTAGPHSVTATLAGHADGELRDVVAPADSLRVVLPREGRVSLTVGVPQGSTAPEWLALTFRSEGHPTNKTLFRKWSEREVTQPLVPGKCSVSIATEGFAEFEREFELAPGADLALGELVLDPGVTLSGRVVDPAGRAVAGARVSGADRSAPTDADGRFTIEHVARGDVELYVTADGWFTSKATARAGDTPPVVVVLCRGGALRGVVRDAAGKPEKDAVLPIYPLTGERGSETASDSYVDVLDLDRAGKFSTRLASGRYRVVVERTDGVLDSRDVDVTEGGETDVEFVVRR